MHVRKDCSGNVCSDGRARLGLPEGTGAEMIFCRKAEYVRTKLSIGGFYTFALTQG